MLLAGDVGGTKTLLGLFERAPRRPAAIVERSYQTDAFPSFSSILDAFAADIDLPLRVDAAAIGVAGPVVNQKARLTNIAWDITAAEICVRCGTERVRLLNDLEVIAMSVEVLAPEELHLLQTGIARTDGNAVVIAAGTGLGEACLHSVNGRLRAVPSEGGHADFAPRTDREIELLLALRAQFGRASVEHVLSGPGLLNLHRFTHQGTACPALTRGQPEPELVSQAALDGRCASCMEALDLFVSAYGAEAGNLALRSVATSGVFVAGGIAPKILPALSRGGFMDAFLQKPPMIDLLARMPVSVILNRDAGLLGAAVGASELM